MFQHSAVLFYVFAYLCCVWHIFTSKLLTFRGRCDTMVLLYGCPLRCGLPLVYCGTQGVLYFYNDPCAEFLSVCVPSDNVHFIGNDGKALVHNGRNDSGNG